MQYAAAHSVKFFIVTGRLLLTPYFILLFPGHARLSPQTALRYTRPVIMTGMRIHYFPERFRTLLV